MTERQGEFTVPTRLYLTPKHRVQLEHLVREREVDLADLVSQIVADYLDALPDAPARPDAPAPDRATDLRRRRAEIARLRARRDAAGASAPAWLGAYIAELEDEIQRLEG
jgi:predicted aminopeptidase